MSTIKVTRAFLYKGDPVKIGTIIDLPAEVAAEVIAMGKAERAVRPPINDIPELTDIATELEEAPRRRGRPPKTKE